MGLVKRWRVTLTEQAGLHGVILLLRELVIGLGEVGHSTDDLSVSGSLRMVIALKCDRLFRLFSLR